MSSPNITRISSTRHNHRINSPRSSSSFSSHKKWLLPTYFFNSLILSLLLALTCLLYLSSPNRIPDGCDVFEGSWQPSDSHPLYNSSACPFVERGFDCVANGRRDLGYLRWRWKPRQCELPRFDVFGVLERLRGKRVVFVGDSMSRTQWESLICMLMMGVDDVGSVFEINGNGISKTIGFLGVEFRGYNFSVEFFRSVFLVQQGVSGRRGRKRVRMVLNLDRMDGVNRRWVGADILVFNSGHWWTPSKLFDV